MSTIEISQTHWYEMDLQSTNIQSHNQSFTKCHVYYVLTNYYQNKNNHKIQKHTHHLLIIIKLPLENIFLGKLIGCKNLMGGLMLRLWLFIGCSFLRPPLADTTRRSRAWLVQAARGRGFRKVLNFQSAAAIQWVLAKSVSGFSHRF